MTDQELVDAAARSIHVHPNLVIASAVKADAVVIVLRTGGKHVIPRSQIEATAPEIDEPVVKVDEPVSVPVETVDESGPTPAAEEIAPEADAPLEEEPADEPEAESDVVVELDTPKPRPRQKKAH